jgi:uncharacterized protein YqcC (DUF446 family)
MDIAVSPKKARRRGVTKEHIQEGSVTEEQRSRRAFFGETLRAVALLPWVFVAPRLQILKDMLARRSATQAKMALSSNIQNFLSGC